MPYGAPGHGPAELEAALRARGGRHTPSHGHPFAVDVRHEDGEHWVELHRYPSKDLAKEAADYLASAKKVDAANLRVRKIQAQD